MDRTLISNKSKEEIRGVVAIIPEPRTPAEQRMVVNSKIRQLLYFASNDTVAYLALRKNHQLSLKELFYRLKEGRFTDLSELFRLLNWVLSSGGRSRRKLLGMAFSQAVNVGSKSTTFEVAECFRDFNPTISVVCGDLGIHIDICEVRSDKEEIIKLLESWGINTKYEFCQLFYD